MRFGQSGFCVRGRGQGAGVKAGGGGKDQTHNLCEILKQPISWLLNSLEIRILKPAMDFLFFPFAHSKSLSTSLRTPHDLFGAVEFIDAGVFQANFGGKQEYWSLFGQSIFQVGCRVV